DAPPAWEPALREVFPGLGIWDRVIASLPGPETGLSAPAGWTIRRLTRLDAPALWGLSRENAWIANTWGGPDGLAGSGMAWGAFEGARIAAAACSFYVGERFEEIGVVTEAAARGRGLSHACATGLCGDIIARGRRPSWSTSPDNAASRRVAEKLGFCFERADRLYALGLPIPAAAGS
ncbi:MAG TPA: GNAT family N-acetyltransferase, partial [Herpetosiphonaceae bacterium]